MGFEDEGEVEGGGVDGFLSLAGTSTGGRTWASFVCVFGIEVTHASIVCGHGLSHQILLVRRPRSLSAQAGYIISSWLYFSSVKYRGTRGCSGTLIVVKCRLANAGPDAQGWEVIFLRASVTFLVRHATNVHIPGYTRTHRHTSRPGVGWNLVSTNHWNPTQVGKSYESCVLLYT